LRWDSSGAPSWRKNLWLAPEPSLIVFFVIIALAAGVTILGSALPLRRRFALRARAHLARRMMPGTRATNKAMFWRIIRRLLGANRGRLSSCYLRLARAPQ